MRCFIALSILVCVAVAIPPSRLCPGRGDPNGYGLCASEGSNCDVGFTCVNGICCRSNDFNKPRLCPIGKPFGYGRCDMEGNCLGDLECIADVCCKIPKERVCPAGKPGGFGSCDNDDDCENSNHYCFDTEGDEKVCCEDGESSSEEEEEECQVNPCEGFVCANEDLPQDELTCTFDADSCQATVTYDGEDVTGQCLPDNSK
ncbi:uncharacterized protein LOC128164001 isoform X1 [Crassostrea angulata]|uniref:uncharacterized protein LOC128164001 isoform X1 n=1 Tax=Magallana angulata TaxID=2784310 RepID=UPI0022B1FF01|nr:uncharacterized protein LOC128164001 isoform X1 [Crassostrea angulata]